jgi:branched-chain amino acid transport system permease protein
MPRRLAPVIALLVVAAMPVLLADVIGQPYLIALASRILILALAAVSLDLILGYGGMVSFGHAAFFGLGGYVVAILTFHASQGTPLAGAIPGSTELLIVLPAAVAVSALAAAAIGALSIRTTGFSFIMITLAFAQMVYFLFVTLRIYGGDDGLSMRSRNTLAGYPLRDNATFYYVCLTALGLFLLICRRLVRSRFGLVLVGCKENERRMATLGFSTYGTKLIAFCIAGAGAGAAGALLANLDRFASPDTLHWKMSGELLVMVIMGGVGTLYGAVLGAAVFVGLETVLRIWTDHWMFVLGPILVAVVLFARRGIWHLLRC